MLKIHKNLVCSDRLHPGTQEHYKSSNRPRKKCCTLQPGNETSLPCNYISFEPLLHRPCLEILDSLGSADRTLWHLALSWGLPAPQSALHVIPHCARTGHLRCVAVLPVNLGSLVNSVLCFLLCKAAEEFSTKAVNSNNNWCSVEHSIEWTCASWLWLIASPLVRHA